MTLAVMLYLRTTHRIQARKIIPQLLEHPFDGIEVYYANFTTRKKLAVGWNMPKSTNGWSWVALIFMAPMHMA